MDHRLKLASLWLGWIAAGAIAAALGGVLTLLAFSFIRAIRDIPVPVNGIHVAVVDPFVFIAVASALCGSCLGIAHGNFLELVGVPRQSWRLTSLIGGLLGALSAEIQFVLLALADLKAGASALTVVVLAFAAVFGVVQGRAIRRNVASGGWWWWVAATITGMSAGHLWFMYAASHLRMVPAQFVFVASIAGALYALLTGAFFLRLVMRQPRVAQVA